MKKLIIYLALLITISCTSQNAAIITNTNTVKGFVMPPNGVRVLVKGGQSNSVGDAPNSDATTAELAVHTNVKIYNTSYTVKWRDLAVGFNNYGNANAHGSEIGLVNNFNTYFPGETLYIIKWGASGTNITFHLVGGANYVAVYDARVKAGINELLAQGKRVFVYFSWLQGEHDSLNSTNTGLYPSRFTQLVNEQRGILGANMPWLNTTIIETEPNDITINDVFRNNAISDQFMSTFNANGANHIGDNLHYNYTEQKNIGLQECLFMRDYTPVEITSPL